MKCSLQKHCGMFSANRTVFIIPMQRIHCPNALISWCKGHLSSSLVGVEKKCVGLKLNVSPAKLLRKMEGERSQQRWTLVSKPGCSEFPGWWLLGIMERMLSLQSECYLSGLEALLFPLMLAQEEEWPHMKQTALMSTSSGVALMARIWESFYSKT